MKNFKSLLLFGLVLFGIAIAGDIFGQPPGPPGGGGGGPPCWPPPCVPIDGGLVYLAIGGALYGIKKAYDKRSFKDKVS